MKPRHAAALAGRALVAILGGLILGNLFAVPAALFIDLLAEYNATGGQWLITLPNAIYAIVMAFLAGFFAGLIFGRRGELIGALTQVAPLLVLIVLLPAPWRVRLAFWASVGLVPAILGGMYGVRFPKRYVATFLNYSAFAAVFVFGLWGFILCLQIVRRAAGFWGVVIGFTVAPATFAAAPWYALVAWGSWFPLLVCYGGAILAAFMFWAASKLDAESSEPMCT